MAISINTGNLSSPQYNTYSIKKFNGVDYTTTPISVDGSRAIDMSNYLPEGEALVKRYGVKQVDTKFGNDGDTYENVVAIKCWKYKENDYCIGAIRSISEADNGLIDVVDDLVLFYGKLGASMNRLAFLTRKTHNVSNTNEINYKFEHVYLGDYLWLLGEGTYGYIDESDYRSFIQEAYKPTLLLNVGDEDSLLTPRIYESINLLSSEFKVEIKLKLNELYDANVEGVGHRFTYDIGRYFNDYIRLTEINGKKFVEDDFYGWEYVAFEPKELGLDDEVYTNNIYLQVLPKMTHLSYANNDYVHELFENGKQVFYCKKYKLMIRIPKMLDDNYEQQPIDQIVSLTLTFKIAPDSATNNMNTILKCDKMFVYGVQSKNALFFTGNPDYPHVDYHTEIVDTSEEEWKQYLYVPDDSYQAFGDSSTAIVGYGIFNNGSMAVIKESDGNNPNVYVRNGEYYTETITYNALVDINEYKEYTTSYVDVRYPTFITGCYVNATKDSDIVYYDNKVIINNQEGIYYIVLNDSTATQTYSAFELSYMIRNDLSTDLSRSKAFVYEDRLFVYRKSKNGTMRVYVADKTRYTFIDSKQQYEWWVLDDIVIDNVYVENNNLIIINEGLFFNYNKSNNFIDSKIHRLTPISVGGDLVSPNVFIDYDNGRLIMSKDLAIFKEVDKFSDKEKAYQRIIDGLSVDIGGFILKTGIFLNGQVDQEIFGSGLGYGFNFNEVPSEIFNGIKQLHFEGFRLVFDDNKYISNYNLEFYETAQGNYIYLVVNQLDGEKLNSQLDIELSFKIFDREVNVHTLYAFFEGQWYDIRYCKYSDYNWYYIGENLDDYIELGNAVFNCAKMKLYGIVMRDIVVPNDDGIVTNVTLKVNSNVKSYWMSGYNGLERLDYLKTANYIYFAPEPRRGGYTNVSYNTYRKTIGYMTYAVTDKFNFEEVTFDDFNFGRTEFGRTFSSKKKIKNFSFLQLRFTSDDEKDSTISSITFRYKLSKQNKGVR